MRYLDHELGRLFDGLARRGLLERTVVVVTGDHGEEFAEHALVGHGHSLYLPSLHVPLILAGPGVPAGRVLPMLVTTRDLARTIVDLAALPGRAGLPGSSLARFWRADAPVVDSSVAFASVRYAAKLPRWYPVSKGDLYSLFGNGLHVIRNGDGVVEAYDLGTDLWEQHDVAGDSAYAARLSPLRQRLAALAAQSSPPAEAGVPSRPTHPGPGPVEVWDSERRTSEDGQAPASGRSSERFRIDRRDRVRGGPP